MQLRGQSRACTHKNSLHQSLPTPISLCRCLPLGRLSDYCVGMEREQWIHSSLENLQQPIWLSTPIRHTAHHPLVLRIERVRRGGLNMSTKQWPPPSEPWRHTWMPDGEANYVFFLVGAASLREHFITGGNHETARGIPILEFGMKCVEAQPRSAAFETPNVSMLFKWNQTEEDRLVLMGEMLRQSTQQAGTGDGGDSCPPPVDNRNQVLSWLYVIGWHTGRAEGIKPHTSAVQPSNHTLLPKHYQHRGQWRRAPLPVSYQRAPDYKVWWFLIGCC